MIFSSEQYKTRFETATPAERIASLPSFQQEAHPDRPAPLSLIPGGGLSNLIGRVLHDHPVIDFMVIGIG